MNFIILLTYFFTLKNKPKDQLGYDERYPLIEKNFLMSKIIENHKKKELLDYLSSENISIINKTNKINKFYNNNNSPKPFNLTSGGLFKDWNFEI